MLSGERLGPAHGGRAQQLVVLLHGLGADGRDLIEIGTAWRDALPDAAFLAPDAPDPCDMGPYGRQWFSLMDRRPAIMAAAAAAAVPALKAGIEAELASLHLAPTQLGLVGFSQGMMMALATALRWPAPIAAIIGYSGALLGAEAFVPADVQKSPILLVQGEEDEIIPAAAQAAAVVELRRLGMEPETLMLPDLGHAIDGRGLAAGADFLQRAFGA